MKTLKRNEQKIFYSNYELVTDVTRDGMHTGEKQPHYSTIKEVFVNVSPARGEASVEMFGTDVNYSNTIVTAKDYGWDENTIMWIGIDNPLETPHNYTVVGVAKSINNNAYAIRKVDVSD